MACCRVTQPSVAVRLQGLVPGTLRISLVATVFTGIAGEATHAGMVLRQLEAMDDTTAVTTVHCAIAATGSADARGDLDASMPTPPNLLVLDDRRSPSRSPAPLLPRVVVLSPPPGAVVPFSQVQHLLVRVEPHGACATPATADASCVQPDVGVMSVCFHLHTLAGELADTGGPLVRRIVVPPAPVNSVSRCVHICSVVVALPVTTTHQVGRRLGCMKPGVVDASVAGGFVPGAHKINAFAVHDPAGEGNPTAEARVMSSVTTVAWRVVASAAEGEAVAQEGGDQEVIEVEVDADDVVDAAGSVRVPARAKNRSQVLPQSPPPPPPPPAARGDSSSVEPSAAEDVADASVGGSNTVLPRYTAVEPEVGKPPPDANAQTIHPGEGTQLA